METSTTEMTSKMEDSEICSFYRDKHILLTGVTGFMGKAVLEKLLRVCQPKMVYLLIRHKKSVEPQKRLLDLTQSPFFERLKKEMPNFMDHISIVSGDVSSPGLDLVPSDREILVQNVQVVIHGAATVNFDENIKLATRINVQGILTILDLTREMKNIQVIVHVSTAYSNCTEQFIKEQFYESPISSENLIKLTESLKEDKLEQITPYIMDKWPNTYVFTKAVAEEAVKTNGKGLPIAIFRPAMIISTRSEPIPGWSDNLYGPQGFTLATGLGLMHVALCDGNCRAEIVPLDMAVNCLLAVGYTKSLSTSHENIPIFNFCQDPGNPITWNEYMSICLERAREIPLSKSLWYCSITLVRSWLLYFILSFILHTIPALIIDAGMVLLNKKPRALNIYKKINKVSNVLAFFSTTTWTFSTDNTISLWKSLSTTDKELFDFDMASLNFKPYLNTFVEGVRSHIVKEDISTVPLGKRKMFLFYLAHRLVQFVFFTSLGWCSWKLMRLFL